MTKISVGHSYLQFYNTISYNIDNRAMLKYKQLQNIYNIFLLAIHYYNTKIKYNLLHSLVHIPTLQPYDNTSKLALHKEHSQNGQHLLLILLLQKVVLPLVDT